MMKEILIEIDRLAEEELNRANKVNPMFSSDHEGCSVLREEIEEAIKEMQSIVRRYDELWKGVKDNQSDVAKAAIREIKYFAEYGAAELIQVIAMCDKFVKSQEVRN